MEKIDLKNKLEKLISDFNNNGAWKNSEESVQAQYTLDLLAILGWQKKNIVINQGQEVKTGKKPDIILKDDNNYTIIVIESKDAKKKDKLDGRYQTKTFKEQLIGYCEAEGVYWGILTNFVEWRIYNTHQKVLYDDRKYAFHELLWNDSDRNNYIDLLSEEGLEFLIKIVKTNLVEKQGRWDLNKVFYPSQDEIKDDFFAKIKNWRSVLRSYIYTNYKNKYTISDIELITQKLIDRLIFIDFCSDNSIISQDILHAILYTKTNIYSELKRVFNDMNEKFNTELFSPDAIDEMSIDNDIIELIVRELTVVDFTKLSVHVIGEVYENYLGELLEQNKKQVKLDNEKGLVNKKNQGIYYTPEPIVDYIIKITLGKKLAKCKTEKEIEKIKVLDPACGSGSFLIRVFDEFLFHYKRVNKEGLLFEFETRRKILQKNIYGVDLDERAVEIAKLNLMIKALEKTSWRDLKGRKLLPNLKLNIRCGNSLISGERFKKGEMLEKSIAVDLELLSKLRSEFQHSKIDENEKINLFDDIKVLEYRINMKINSELDDIFKGDEKYKPINYTIAFPEVMVNGGFDCIVGNPPYISYYARFKNLMMKNEEIFYKTYYNFISEKNRIIDKKQITGKFNSIMFFIEKSYNLLNEVGECSYIVDLSITKKPFEDIRSFLVENGSILEVVKDIEGWDNVGSGQIILHFSKQYNAKKKIILKKGLFGCNNLKYSQKAFLSFFTDFSSITSKSNLIIPVIKKIDSQSQELKTYFPGKLIRTSINFGGKKEKFIVNKNENLAKPLAEGSNSITHAYCKPRISTYIRYDKDIIHSINRENDKKEIYEQNKQGKVGGLGDVKIFKNPKVVVRQAGDKIVATYVEEELYLDYSLFAIANREEQKSDDLNLKTVLALLNSKLMTFYAWHKNIIQHGKGGTPQIRINGIRSLPIPNLLESEISELKKYADLLLSSNSKENSNAQDEIKRKAIEEEIDQLIYKIYSLEPDEILMVENIEDSK